MAKLTGFKGIQTFLLPKVDPCCSTGSSAPWDTPQTRKNSLRIKTKQNKKIFIFQLLQEVQSINFSPFQNSLRAEAQPREQGRLKSLRILWNLRQFQALFPKKVKQVLDTAVLRAHRGGWAGETLAKILLPLSDVRNICLQTTWDTTPGIQLFPVCELGSGVGSSCRQWESSPPSQGRWKGNICSFWWLIKSEPANNG